MCYSDVRSSLSPEAEAERDRLPRNERLAIATAVEKLETLVQISRLRIKARLWGSSISVNSDHEPVAAPAARRAERRLKELDT